MVEAGDARDGLFLRTLGPDAPGWELVRRLPRKPEAFLLASPWWKFLVWRTITSFRDEVNEQ